MRRVLSGRAPHPAPRERSLPSACDNTSAHSCIAEHQRARVQPGEWRGGGVGRECLGGVARAPEGAQWFAARAARAAAAPVMWWACVCILGARAWVRATLRPVTEMMTELRVHGEIRFQRKTRSVFVQSRVRDVRDGPWPCIYFLSVLYLARPRSDAEGTAHLKSAVKCYFYVYYSL